MIKQFILTVLIIIGVMTQTKAQDSVPLRSDVRFEVTVDSLQRSNSPQDLTVSLSNNAGEEIEYFTLKINETKVLWTLVSAEIDDQPLWLILNEGKADRANVLAWQYDLAEDALKFFPPKGLTGSDLKLVIRLSLLRANIIEKNSEKEIALLAQSESGLSRCETTGVGNKVSFK